MIDIRIGGPIRRQNQPNEAGDLQEEEDDPDDDAACPEYLPRTKKPASLMFLGVIASTGEVCPPIWFPEGFRLSSADYIQVLRIKVVPWIRRIASNHARPFCFQQDGAPAHTAKATISYLKEEGITFWGPSMWPPCSPDVNPLDYAVWSYVQQMACKTRPTSLQAMRKQVSTAWNRIPPEKILRFCVRYRARLNRVVAAKGGIMED